MNASAPGSPTDLTAANAGPMVGPGSLDRPSRRRRAGWPGVFAAIWPTQRVLLVSCLGAVVALIAALFWFRSWSDGVLTAIGNGPDCRGPEGADAADCRQAITDALFERIRTPEVTVQFACAALTAGGAVLLGVSAFARDFEQRTQVLLLTQSVSRARWWSAKVLMVGVPWVLATVPLGAAATLSLRDDALYLGDAMDPARFYFSPWSLPLVALVGFGVGTAAGILLRSTLGALLVAALLTVLAVVGAELARPHLVPTTRLVSSVDVYAIGEAPAGSWFRGTGYLDAQGDEVEFTYACASLDIPDPTPEEVDRWMADCQRQQGITAGYTDVIEPQWFTPLRLLWSGVLIATSGLFLLTGFLYIRRRVL